MIESSRTYSFCIVKKNEMKILKKILKIKPGSVKKIFTNILIF